MAGWGSGLWGGTSWGAGSSEGTLHIPTSSDFTLADVSGVQLSPFASYIEVNATSGTPWIAYDALTQQLNITSSSGLYTAAQIQVPTTDTWTLEVNFQPVLLPTDFSDLSINRLFFGAFNVQGLGGGIAVSREGIAIVDAFTGAASAIPGSQNLIAEGSDFYTLRIVMLNGQMNVYITKSELLPIGGHVLRYTVYAADSPAGISDGMVIDLQGSTAQDVMISAQAIRFSDLALIPNSRPISIPGPDGTVSLGSIANFDGSSSYDPEGQPVTYLWSLIGVTSDTVFKTNGTGGNSPVGHPYLWSVGGNAFSPTAAPLLQPGDTLVVDEVAYTVAIGEPEQSPMWEITPSSLGKYVRVAGVWADDTIALTAPIAHTTVGRPWALFYSATFFDDQTREVTFATPDSMGAYKVQLVVNDGQLDSLPAWVLVDVAYTAVTLGVIPDVSWIWHHLTDFMNMLEDRDVVERTWSGFAQGAANILMSAWQIDYNKSLKDIQKVFQKRWLSYSLLVAVDNAAVIVGDTIATVAYDLTVFKVQAGDFVKFQVTSIVTGHVQHVVCPVLSAGQDTIQFNTTPLDLVYDGDPSEYTVVFFGVLKATVLPVSPLIVDIPRLQEIIVDPPSYLTQNQDYHVVRNDAHTSSDIVFETNTYTTLDYPPDKLWAEVTYIDNAPAIEANFGSLVDLTIEDFRTNTSTVDKIDYLSAVRGLWYAYFGGPSFQKVQVGAQILLGLPFAEEEGVVRTIDLHFSSTMGRMFLEDIKDAAIVRGYTFLLIPGQPPEASVAINVRTGDPIKVGDTVGQFEPLCKGVEVIDFVKDPMWPAAYSGLFKEVQKFFIFLARINVDVFEQQNLQFCLNFMRKIKPHYTRLLFALLKEADTCQIDIQEYTKMSISRRVVTSADTRNVGGYRWDDNIGGGPFAPPYDSLVSDGETFQHYDAAVPFLYDRPILFPNIAVSIYVHNISANTYTLINL
ncbi:hypothetical protein UFOVP276_111 [uncultured Caudovirales phage]|uniref:Uncharacterized protein n=1 Tax=uncultured Caudovirales phage TaxID=2100421 RepID=A0A6J5L7W7_9CAUD|nr:hypothetical protein UFOVP127_5 [uncultured Caudovirales phage]CAB4135155.1 hypothetical protein UFOVP276_111 [uncultured Caudovirales phage]